MVRAIGDFRHEDQLAIDKTRLFLNLEFLLCLTLDLSYSQAWLSFTGKQSDYGQARDYETGSRDSLRILLVLQ